MKKRYVNSKMFLIGIVLSFFGLGFISGCIDTGGYKICRWYGFDIGNYSQFFSILLNIIGLCILFIGIFLLVIHLKELRSYW